MGLVHALVAEVLAYLVHALEAAHDQTLEVKLGGDAHVHVLVERVEVRDKGTRARTARDALQDRGLHLGVARVIQYAAQGTHDGGPLEEGVLHALVDYQVHITLAVAQLGVVKGVEHIALGVRLHDRQGAKALAQHGHLRHMHAYLPRLCAEHIALHTDEVTKVQALLEDHVVQVLVLTGTNGVALHIQLYAPLAVLQFGKAGLAHDTLAHDASRDAHVAAVRGCGGNVGTLAILIGLGRLIDRKVHKGLAYLCAPGIHRVLCSGIGVNAQVAQLLQVVSPDNLLVAQFQYVHRTLSIVLVRGHKVTQKNQMRQEMGYYSSNCKARRDGLAHRCLARREALHAIFTPGAAKKECCHDGPSAPFSISLAHETKTERLHYAKKETKQRDTLQLRGMPAR